MQGFTCAENNAEKVNLEKTTVHHNDKSKVTSFAIESRVSNCLSLAEANAGRQSEKKSIAEHHGKRLLCGQRSEMNHVEKWRQNRPQQQQQRQEAAVGLHVNCVSREHGDTPANHYTMQIVCMASMLSNQDPKCPDEVPQPLV